MAMKDTSKAIFKFVKEHDGENFTAPDIAEALGMETRSVNGSLTGMQKKGWVVREEAEIQLEDKSHKKVKFIRITDTGRAVDIDAE